MPIHGEELLLKLLYYLLGYCDYIYIIFFLIDLIFSDGNVDVGIFFITISVSKHGLVNLRC